MLNKKSLLIQRNNNVIHSQEEKQSIKTEPKMVQILNKNCKAAIIYFKEIKKNMLKMSKERISAENWELYKRTICKF